MENLLKRMPTIGETTFGQWFIDGAFECYTLEDAIREVEGEPVALWKIHGQTAIPSGRYRLAIENSPKYGPDTITVLDVPGFSFIRVHSGNRHEDSLGCPLVGDRINKNLGTISGGLARDVKKRLAAKVKAALDRGEDVWLVVQNP
jgi:hypothetical protein